MYKDKIIEQTNNVQVRGYCVHYYISKQSGHRLFDLVGKIQNILNQIVRGIEHVQR